jgi:hypothetical protein
MRMIRFVAAAGALLCGAAQVSRAQSSALTLAEVMDLRKHGVSTRQIVRNATEYCISFALTDSTVRELETAGVDTSLVSGLRLACTNRTSRVSEPGIVVDDDFSFGATRDGLTWNDSRCIARADSTGLRLENRRSESVCMMGYPAGPLDANVRIELTVRGVGLTRGGLVVLGFGRDAIEGIQYSYSITADRRVELCRSENDACRRLVFKTRVIAVKQGSEENMLAVEIRGREVSLFVNDFPIGTYVADSDVAGSISLGVGPGTKVLVKHVRARLLSSATALR